MTTQPDYTPRIMALDGNDLGYSPSGTGFHNGGGSGWGHGYGANYGDGNSDDYGDCWGDGRGYGDTRYDGDW